MIQELTHLAILTLGVAAGGAEPRDPFGGWSGARGQATGFFHAEQIDDVWWLITPDGNAFFSKGANHISYSGDTSPKLGYSPYGRAVAEKYGSAAKWAEATAERLRSWGCNTVGAWSSREMFEQRVPYTVILGLADSAGANWLKGEVADVFSDHFQQAVRAQAQKQCAPRARDPFLLGYFSDNELRWSADWRSKKTLLEDFIARPADAPGKQAAVRLLRSRHASVDAFNQAWGAQLKSWDELAALVSLPMTNDTAKAAQREFLRDYARAYFKTGRDAIIAADPNHLLLGCRFAGYAPPEVVEAMGEFVDVVSFNNYSFTAPVDPLRKLQAATGKPVMLTEFSFKAKDSGLPNTKGAGQAIATQQDRADHFDRYVTALAQLPFVVGFHWFQYSDQPVEGRFDGENSNYGLVTGQDEPWPVLTARMKQVNSRLEETHSRSAKP
ncbi:MAG: beta-agarase [Chloroflexi bacterium]|nr:beta-agarase [Chloroflexota bacterium]